MLCSRLLLLVGLQALLVRLSSSVIAFTAAGLFRTTRGGRAREEWSISTLLASGVGSSRTALWMEGGGRGAPGEPGLKDVIEVMDKGFKDMNARIDGMDKGFKDMNARIDGMDKGFKDMNARIDGMDKGFKDMNARIDGMDKGFKDMNARIDGMDKSMIKEFARINRQLSWAAEGRARDLTVDLLGRDYARSLVARSIQDLLLCFPAGEDPLSTYSEWGRRAMEAVVREKVPERLLGCVSSKLEKLNGATAWIGPDGTVDFKSLGLFIGRCQDESTRIPLMKLRDVLAIADEHKRVEAMLRCNSAGLMCVTAAAHADLYLNASTPHLFPPELLEFDMRGRVEFPAREPRFAYIDIGEVKMTVGFKEAIGQLGVRLGVLKWLVLQTQPYDYSGEGVRLVGRLFSGRSSVDDRGDSMVPVDMMDRAEKEWGFSLYMHLFDG